MLRFLVMLQQHPHAPSLALMAPDLYATSATGGMATTNKATPTMTLFQPYVNHSTLTPLNQHDVLKKKKTRGPPPLFLSPRALSHKWLLHHH